MEFPRAQLYQAHITHFFQARGASAHNVLDTLTIGPDAPDSPPVRRYVSGAGNEGRPIDVELWAASMPIDVDEFVESERAKKRARRQDRRAAGGTQEPALQRALPQSLRDQQPTSTDNNIMFECCICSGTFVHPVVTLCMHLYCDKCIHRNFRESFACPICRTVITSPPLRDVLFEGELARAVVAGAVEAPSLRGRRHPYDWTSVRFPSS
ncbi:hypothetical protein DFH09DRAFT_1300409 [Mycena vulgaris]|nr:hypothetical protein DFH09DRAFT_1300409 [Mycena vulgaris]